MRAAVLAFALGVIACHQLSALPSSLWYWTVLPLLLLLTRAWWWRVPAAFALGLLWAAWRAALVLDLTLPAYLEGEDVLLSGYVADIPRHSETQISFTFHLDSFTYQDQNLRPVAKLRLTWYTRDPTQKAQALNLRAGQHWRFQARLKAPRALHNPGGFDYSAWQFSHGIGASGYVRGQAERLADSPWPRVAALRQTLWQQIHASLPDYPAQAPLLSALVLGERQGMSAAQWETLRATGTSHLLAISGLHIGWIALCGVWLGRGLAFFSGSWLLRYPKQVWAGVFGLLFAFSYALLAGFSIPTQRAFIMIATLIFSILMMRSRSLSHGLALALLLILLWSPAAVLAAGLWLSFGAVAVILYAFSNRLRLRWTWVKVHLIVALGLIPILLAWFGQIPWLSPLANLLAVPWVAFLVVPEALFGALLLNIWPDVGTLLLNWSAFNLELLWVYLEAVQNYSWGISTLPTPPEWMLGSAMIGVLIILLPRGFPGRWLGLVWLLPIFLYTPPRPAPGTAWFTLLDVGQGLASVVRTQHYTLVYDSGPRFSERFDAGESIVVPFLHAQGIKRIDRFILSHSDLDHSGGAPALRARVLVIENFSGTPLDSSEQPCVRGQTWQWDGVDFEILHPPPDTRWLSANNRSCVLRVGTGAHALLLTGDIAADIERELTRVMPQKLTADILLAPHHGSRTSSSAIFLATVNPRYALFSASWRNRFGFPKEDVVARYHAVGAQTYNTADSGALTFILSADGIAPPVLAREQKQRFWHR
jgi:competence protein ComEC